MQSDVGEAGESECVDRSDVDIGDSDDEEGDSSSDNSIDSDSDYSVSIYVSKLYKNLHGNAQKHKQI